MQNGYIFIVNLMYAFHGKGIDDYSVNFYST